MNITKSLEFTEIISAITSLCKTDRAKQMAKEIHFLTDYNKIISLLKLSSQMRELLMGLKVFPNSAYIDLSSTLKQIEVKDSCIDIQDMPLLLDSLTCIKELLFFFSDIDTEKYKDILQLLQGIEFNNAVYYKCNEIIDSEGNIKTSCSPLLQEIFQKQKAKQRQIDKQIASIMQQSKKQGYASEDADISIRDGAMVIPVKATYKKQVKGILHDTSASGQTFFIEPEEIVELNFDMKELFFEQKREVHRILFEFSELLRQNIDSLRQSYDMLVRIDFLKAKAEFALQINASMPQIEKTSVIHWYDARHPLLEKSLKNKGKQIVPLNIEINMNQRILVISGPNAGGKSVCLKTVALLQYMLQCGLLVPMKEVSICGLFDKIFLSIGDEQSLEDDLSTYSSHLKNLAEICNEATNHSLFLIDELGAGTDPQSGGAIAESVMEYLNNREAFGVITTHYSILKHLAFDNQGIVNAAMLFDTDNMKPLYILSIGTPGSSFAYEIAAKTGLPKYIIENAKKKEGNQNIRFEERLQQIQVDKLKTQERLRSAENYDNLLYQTLQKYRELTLKIETDKRKILDKARSEAKEILLNANQKIEHTIEEIKTTRANKQVVKELKQAIKDKITQIDKQTQEQIADIEQIEPKLKKENLKIVNTPIELGDYVIFPSSIGDRKSVV